MLHFLARCAQILGVFKFMISISLPVCWVFWVRSEIATGSLNFSPQKALSFYICWVFAKVVNKKPDICRGPLEGVQSMRSGICTTRSTILGWSGWRWTPWWQRGGHFSPATAPSIRWPAWTTATSQRWTRRKLRKPSAAQSIRNSGDGRDGFTAPPGYDHQTIRYLAYPGQLSVEWISQNCSTA